MAVSKVSEMDLDEALQDIAKTSVPIIYIVDSFGSMYSQNIQYLIAFLKNPQYRLLPLLDVIQNYIHPLQKDIPWGYHVHYLITGALNEHPRSALKWMASESKDDFVAFMKEMHDYE